MWCRNTLQHAQDICTWTCRYAHIWYLHTLTWYVSTCISEREVSIYLDMRRTCAHARVYQYILHLHTSTCYICSIMYMYSSTWGVCIPRHGQDLAKSAPQWQPQEQEAPEVAIHTHIYTHSYIYIYIYIYIHTQIHIYMNICTWMHVRGARADKVNTRKHTQRVVYGCIYVCVYIYIYIYTHTHTHIRTCMHT